MYRRRLCSLVGRELTIASLSSDSFHLIFWGKSANKGLRVYYIFPQDNMDRLRFLPLFLLLRGKPFTCQPWIGSRGMYFKRIFASSAPKQNQRDPLASNKIENHLPCLKDLKCGSEMDTERFKELCFRFGIRCLWLRLSNRFLRLLFRVCCFFLLKTPLGGDLWLAPLPLALALTISLAMTLGFCLSFFGGCHQKPLRVRRDGCLLPITPLQDFRRDTRICLRDLQVKGVLRSGCGENM